MWAITSPQIMKIYKDKGSPCLMPLEGIERSSGTPLTRTEMDTDVTQSIIQLIRFEANPNLVRQALMS